MDDIASRWPPFVMPPSGPARARPTAADWLKPSEQLKVALEDYRDQVMMERELAAMRHFLWLLARTHGPLEIDGAAMLQHAGESGALVIEADASGGVRVIAGAGEAA